jgi:hypothetical protein
MKGLDEDGHDVLTKLLALVYTVTHWLLHSLLHNSSSKKEDTKIGYEINLLLFYKIHSSFLPFLILIDFFIFTLTHTQRVENKFKMKKNQSF